MVILSAMLEFECSTCIAYEACCITPKLLRDPWWSVSSGTAYHRDQEPARNVWKNALWNGDLAYGSLVSRWHSVCRGTVNGK